MIGIPFDSEQCAFIASAALNSNQGDSAVPDTNNLRPHNLVWNFVENKLQWVDTLSNLIVQELAGGGGSAITNEAYAIVSAGPFDLNTINSVPGADNYLLLPAGTYVFDAEYSYIPDAGGAETAVLQIRTNVSQAVTTVNGTDVVEAERDTNVTYAAGVVVTQTAKTEPLTFAAPFIVKTALSVLANAAFAENVILRAILIK